MFDIGFSELLVIGIVALVVIGPERMPAFARTAGHLLGRAQRYVTQVKADIDREVNFQDFERAQETITATARQWEDNVRREYEAARNAVAAPAAAAQAAVVELHAESVAAGPIRGPLPG
jgi:sec-independent protein translocase protein TatB